MSECAQIIVDRNQPKAKTNQRPPSLPKHTHSLTVPLTHSLTHSLTHKLSLTHSLTHSLFCSVAYSPAAGCSRSSSFKLNRPTNQPTNQPTAVSSNSSQTPLKTHCHVSHRLFVPSFLFVGPACLPGLHCCTCACACACACACCWLLLVVVGCVSSLSVARVAPPRHRWLGWRWFGSVRFFLLACWLAS